jgi:hypothetical protein
MNKYAVQTALAILGERAPTVIVAPLSNEALLSPDNEYAIRVMAADRTKSIDLLTEEEARIYAFAYDEGKNTAHD